MFEDCTGLIQPTISLPSCEFFLGNSGGQFKQMFRNCSQLRTYPSLHYKNTTYQNFYGMFENCTALTSAPTLNIVTPVNLGIECYAEMFKGCTHLSTVTTRQEGWSRTDEGVTTYMNRDWLSGASATGTAYVSDIENVPRGNNGIPNGWNLQQVVDEPFIRYQNFTEEFYRKWGNVALTGYNINNEQIDIGFYEETSIGKDTILYSVHSYDADDVEASYPWSPADFYTIVSATPTTFNWDGSIYLPPFTFATIDGQEVQITDDASGIFTSTSTNSGVISGYTILKTDTLTCYTAGTYSDVVSIIPNYISAMNSHHTFFFKRNTPSGVYPTNTYLEGGKVRLMCLYHEPDSSSTLSALKNFAFDLLYESATPANNLSFLNDNILLVGTDTNTTDTITISNIPTNIESFLMIKKFSRTTGEGITPWCDTTGYTKIQIPLLSSEWIGLKSGNSFPTIVRVNDEYKLVDPCLPGAVNVKFGVKGVVSGNVKSMGNLSLKTNSLGIQINSHTISAINFWGQNGLKGLFSGATNLKTTSPDLFKDTVFWCTPSACYDMFKGCTSLSSMPIISGIGAYDPYMFYGMFEGCTNLSTMGTFVVSGATGPYFKQHACERMFSGCTNLTSISGFVGNLTAGMSNDTDVVCRKTGNGYEEVQVTYTG